jgi:hypothetical protein
VLQHEQTFDPDLENGTPGAARIFHHQFSPENVFYRKDESKEVMGSHPGARKKILALKCLKMRCENQRKLPGARKILQDNLTFLNFWSQILIREGP